MDTLTSLHNLATPAGGERVLAAIYGSARTDAPYYIAAPRYSATSAGIRVLHLLCHMLNDMGFEAYMAIYPFARGHGDVYPSLKTPVLTAEVAAYHRRHGRKPIVISPETAPPKAIQGGLRVYYILCTPGLLGGPTTFPDADYVLTYASHFDTSVPSVDHTLFLPVSDPEFFSPPPQPVERNMILAYAGKYVDLHAQKLPDAIRKSAIIITRDKADSPSREQIRDWFRHAKVLYVFENTSLATEAVLCGCPVVCVKNPYFDVLHAEAEQGSMGMTWDMDAAGLEKARSEVSQFRADYLAAISRAPEQLARFIHDTQALARQNAAAIKPVSQPCGRLLRIYDYVSSKARIVVLSIEDVGILKTLYYIARGLWRKALSILRRSR